MKRPRLLIGFVIAATLVWYFGFKEFDYRVSFTSKYAPGLWYYHVTQWDSFKESSISTVEIDSKTPFEEILQRITVNDSLAEYRWSFRVENDSLTRVTVHLKDVDNSFQQKLRVPFGKTDFVKRSIHNVETLAKGMKEKSETFKVSRAQSGSFPEKFCAYISVSSSVERKASSMIYNIGTVMNYINSNEIELIGDPFLVVTNLDLDKGEVAYDFCFPIKEQDSMPEDPEVRFKKMPQTEGLLTEFNGNYSISHNAWYYLLDHAKRNELDVSNLPIEVFRNDPHTGGNGLDWTAEVMLPYNEQPTPTK